MARTRDEIEKAIVSKRRERVLYVSPEGVKKIHAQLDELLTEWESCRTRTDSATGEPAASAATPTS